jgi:hypothetical protein
MNDLPTTQSGMELTKYERQNIKRRYGCDWQTYLRSFEVQQGHCAMCGELPGKRGLKADTKRRRFSDVLVKLICPSCYHVVLQWMKDDKRSQIRSYLCLDDVE